VHPEPDRDEARRSFLAELARVLDPRGVLWLDFPNGAFPIDFWHGGGERGARFHSRGEGFLPTAAEVRRYLADLQLPFRVRALSPFGRLALRRVRRRRYGKILYAPTIAFLAAMRLPGLRRLADSRLNPFLVLEVSRT
jgi:hypothetical protein